MIPKLQSSSQPLNFLWYYLAFSFLRLRSLTHPHPCNPFWTHSANLWKTFILSALPADVNREGKALRPLCFLLLIFQPCLFGQIYARFFLSSLYFWRMIHPRFLFRHLLTSSTTPALPNSPHTGLFYLFSITPSLWDKKPNVGETNATRGEATFLGVNENKRPQPPVSYLTLLSAQKFHHQLRSQYKSLSKPFFLLHPFHSDTCRFM